MSGLRLAAIYGLPPLQLGLCGPKETKALKLLSEFIDGDKKGLGEIRKILTDFKAAFAYYKLIARCNNIADPFDRRVVEAYWLGNKLLEKVEVFNLKQLIFDEFTKRGMLTKKEAQKRVMLVPQRAKPHHSFHVLILGPVGKEVVLTNTLLSLCLVGWGKVKARGKKRLIVEQRGLVRRKGRFFLGSPCEKEIFWEGKFLPKVQIGDTVSFHWERACQILKREEEANLLKYTQLHLSLLNERHK